MRIAETKPYIEEYLGQPMELQLLRQAKILAITFLNRIEGNKLEVRGVTQVLESKTVITQDKDVIEVRNYSDTLEYVELLATDKMKLKISDMCDIQKLVTKDLLADKRQWGNVRTIKVEIADGNGRTVRLMQHLLLLKNGEQLAKFVPSETAIMATRDRYYSSIRQCKSLGSLNPIIEYLAECFAISAEQVIVDSKKMVKKSIDRKPEIRRKKIISFSRQKKEFTLQDILKLLPDVPRRTLQRDLESLVSDKKIKAKGENKARVYFK